MFKGCTFIDFNANVQIPQPATQEKFVSKQSREKMEGVGGSMAYKEFLITDDAIEKKKKRRIILKSREKFPSDFFNENKEEDFVVARRQNTSPCNDQERTRPRRTNSTSVESSAPLGTPKFSSNMQMFLNVRASGKANSHNNYAQGSWARIPVEEETENTAVSPNPNYVRSNKYIRSQSLVDPSTVKEPSFLPDSSIFNERSQVESKKLYKDLRQSQNVPRQGIRHHSVQRPRVVHSPGFQNPLNAIRIKSEANYSYTQEMEGRENTSVSTDVSSKVPSREAPSKRGKMDSPQPHLEYDRGIRSRTPERSLHLPIIRKEMLKNNNHLDTTGNENCNSLIMPQEVIDFPYENSLYLPPSSSNKSSSIETAKRAHSQGNTPGDGKRGKNFGRVTPFSRELRQRGEPMVGQKIFSAKSIIQFQNLLGRPINLPFQFANQHQGKENSVQKTIEPKEVKTTTAPRGRGSSASESRPSLPKETSTKETKETQENEFGEFDDSKLTKEHKDLYEFSFSKNFYKDKLSTVIANNPGILEEQNQLSIIKNSITSEKQYLKVKGKNYMNSEVKKKFSFVRLKQAQS